MDGQGINATSELQFGFYEILCDIFFPTYTEEIVFEL